MASPLRGWVACEPKPKRQFGTMKGLISIDEHFFEPLPEEELELWGV